MTASPLLDMQSQVYQRERRRLAKLRITHELLVGLLKFPDGTRIVSSGPSSQLHDAVELVVESPGLPETYPGSPLLIVSPRYRSDKSAGEHLETSFVDWGI